MTPLDFFQSVRSYFYNREQVTSLLKKGEDEEVIDRHYTEAERLQREIKQEILRVESIKGWSHNPTEDSDN